MRILATRPRPPAAQPPAGRRRVAGRLARLVRGFWAVPVAAAAVGWVLRETVPFGASPGGDIAALLGVVAPTSLTFPCWLHGPGGRPDPAGALGLAAAALLPIA